MKKMFITIVAIFAAAGTAFSKNAEDSEKCYLPKKGAVSTEIQFNPFGNDFNTFKLNDTKLQARWFFTDRDALRFCVGFSLNCPNKGATAFTVTPSSYSTTLLYDRAVAQYELKKKDFSKGNTGNIGIGAGYERHFPIAKRFDIYAGAQMTITYRWAGSYEESNCYDSFKPESAEFNNTWVETRKYSGFNRLTNDYAAFIFKTSAFTGFDFYIYKGLYLGTELGFRVQTEKYLNYSVTETSTQPECEYDRQIDTNNRNSSTSLGFYVLPAIRLGWMF